MKSVDKRFFAFAFVFCFSGSAATADCPGRCCPSDKLFEIANHTPFDENSLSAHYLRTAPSSVARYREVCPDQETGEFDEFCSFITGSPTQFDFDTSPFLESCISEPRGCEYHFVRREGPGIAMMQYAPHQLGIDAWEIDGVFGQRTSRAVSEFQDRAGLAVTGQIDVNTATAILLSVSLIESNFVGM